MLDSEEINRYLYEWFDHSYLSFYFLSYPVAFSVFTYPTCSN